MAGAIAAGILGAPAMFAGFSGCAPDPVRRIAAGAGPDGWTLGDPIRYENLTVFPIFAKSGADTSRFETLDEGLASGEVQVTEQGSEYLRRSRDGSVLPVPQYNSGASVNQLVLINRGKRPVLLLAGEVVSGGKQDRIVGKDRIIPAGGDPLPLDVFCVEHGRWTGASSQFAAAKVMVHPSVREQAAIDSNQTGVWDAVNRGTTARVVAPSGGSGTAGVVSSSSPTAITVEAAPPPPVLSQGVIGGAIASAAPSHSYRKIYESPRIASSVEEFAGEIERRFARATKDQEVVGAVIAYGGEVAWSDAFASSQLFHQYWPKLLRSYVVEALARPVTKEQVSFDDARTFLEHAKGHVREESDPGVYTWRERTEGRYSEIELESLTPSPLTLHWMKVLRTN
jgi:hypothetical protein